MDKWRPGRGESLRRILEPGSPQTSAGRTSSLPLNPEGDRSNVQPSTQHFGRSGHLITDAPRQDVPPSPAVPSSGRGKLLASIAGSSPRPISTKVESIIAEMKPLALCTNEPSVEEKPSEPVIQKGTSGTKINLYANYLRLFIGEGRGLYQYDVQFDPPIESKGAKFFLVKQCQEVIGNTRLFDGQILYLPIKLQQKVTHLDGILSSDQSRIKIIIKFACKRRYGDHDTIHLYNVLFKRIMILLGMAEHGNNFYDPKTAMPIPMHKLEVWPGYVTAVDEFEDGVMLCCDASHRVLRNQTVLDLMRDLEHSGRNTWRKDFVDLIVGQSVLTRYNNKVYRVDDITFQEGPLDAFSKKNGERITYKDYYRQQYNIVLEEDRQPLLKSVLKRKVKDQAGDLISLIPELSYLTGITTEMRNDLRLMKDITQCICVSPSQRLYAVKEFLRKVNNSPEAMKVLADWGLSLDTGFMQLPGRVLPPETIIFGSDVSQRGNAEANWSQAANKNKAITGVEFLNWSVVCTRRDEPTVMTFVDSMLKFGSQLGLRIHKPKVVNMPDDRTENYIRTLHPIINANNQIVMVVLPLARNDKYSAVKRLCCIEQPIPSQVMLTKTVRKGITARAIVIKVALQMNCKLGGTLWSLHIPLQSTMVCGLDAYHDPRRVSDSVGALVCSLNQPLTRWYSRVFFQSPGIEISDALSQAMLLSLTKWREINRKYPEQVILYRDGVSDGQMRMCQDHEIPQIKAAFKRIAPEYNPKFLFVVVQKRNNSRFFQTMPDGQKNPPPGTIVDHTVTRRLFYDFFLVSQHVTQGTVTPTHYIVPHNTTSMSPDQVQRLTYTLTHLYYNWPGTIRVPAPCQYAHKLAYLVGENLHKAASDTLSDKLFFL